MDGLPCRKRMKKISQLKMRVKRFCSVNQDYVGVLKHLDRYVDRGENFVLVLGMD